MYPTHWVTVPHSSTQNHHTFLQDLPSLSLQDHPTFLTRPWELPFRTTSPSHSLQDHHTLPCHLWWLAAMAEQVFSHFLQKHQIPQKLIFRHYFSISSPSVLAFMFLPLCGCFSQGTQWRWWSRVLIPHLCSASTSSTSSMDSLSQSRLAEVHGAEECPAPGYFRHSPLCLKHPYECLSCTQKSQAGQGNSQLYFFSQVSLTFSSGFCLSLTFSLWLSWIFPLTHPLYSLLSVKHSLSLPPALSFSCLLSYLSHFDQ